MRIKYKKKRDTIRNFIDAETRTWSVDLDHHLSVF